jgi:glyoxylase-like metal-dependent hydrolase (beta-lactamase superfamily II)
MNNSNRRLLKFGLSLWLASAAGWAQAPQPDGAGMEPGVLPKTWITGGPRCMEVPDWQVHEYNPDFYIIRESGCTDAEKPFLYLFFGKDRAMLVDTGAGENDIGRFYQTVLHKWLLRNKRDASAPFPLLVTHSHGHGDHTAGDKQFDGMPGVTLIPATVEGVSKQFGISNWPESIGSVDLGGRVIDVIPAPGHQVAATMYYDRRTGVLLTGDSIYPGRLYVSDYPAYVASTRRLVKFTDGKIVTYLLGAHIEQSSTPYLDYTVGSIYQPHEHPLELSHSHLLELDDALTKLNGKPARVAYADFTIWPNDPTQREQMQKIKQMTESKQRATQWNQPN